MPATTLHYINRETGQVEAEVIYGETELRFLYGSAPGRWLRQWVTHPWFSTFNAIPKRYFSGARAIAEFAQRYQVNVAEAEKSLDQYSSLDDFFCRKLKPGARSIADNSDALVSPADGRVLVYPHLQGQTLTVKQQQVSVADLLGSATAAEEVNGGAAAVVRLAPKDYHRFHFPVAGQAGKARLLPGRLESVHPIALDAGAPSFANKRTVTRIETERFGPVYMVDVGALTVGTLVQTYRPGAVSKGQEKGYFRFGGSTVVVLWGRNGPRFDQDLIENSQAQMETLVKYGTQIACKPDTTE